MCYITNYSLSSILNVYKRGTTEFELMIPSIILVLNAERKSYLNRNDCIQICALIKHFTYTNIIQIVNRLETYERRSRRELEKKSRILFSKTK